MYMSCPSGILLPGGPITVNLRLKTKLFFLRKLFTQMDVGTQTLFTHTDNKPIDVGLHREAVSWLPIAGECL